MRYYLGTLFASIMPNEVTRQILLRIDNRADRIIAKKGTYTYGYFSSGMMTRWQQG